MSFKPLVIKLSGHGLEDEAYLSAFAQAIASQQNPVMVVHGGGKDITAMQERLGIQARFVDGVRVTDAPSLVIAEMVLSGLVNKRIVRFLLGAGVNALGLSGVDMGIVRAKKMVAQEDMGFTGEIDEVNALPLTSLLEMGITPVLSPISLGHNTSYNVNADHVAGAIATALSAERLTFISNVEGVLQDGGVIPTLTMTQTHALIAKGVIYGGMIPKVQMALDTLASGVKQVAITNLDGLNTHGGTVFTVA